MPPSVKIYASSNPTRFQVFKCASRQFSVHRICFHSSFGDTLGYACNLRIFGSCSSFRSGPGCDYSADDVWTCRSSLVNRRNNLMHCQNILTFPFVMQSIVGGHRLLSKRNILQTSLSAAEGAAEALDNSTLGVPGPTTNQLTVPKAFFGPLSGGPIIW